MAFWRQLLLALVILAASALAWVKLDPNAPELLARWGIDWAQAAQPRVSDAAPAGNGARRNRAGAPQAAVITAAVTSATINDKLSAIGTGRANASVTVNPYDAGRLTEIAARSGAVVKAGEVLAKLDAEAEEIALDRARIALDDANARLERAQALRKSNAGTAVQVTEAEMARSNAELALRDAELKLQRRSILAPISGIVGIIPVEAGNTVTTQTAILTIDDRSKIIVDFWVPERYAGAVSVGAALTAMPIARPDQVLEGRVSAVDNRIDEASRTLLVQAEIANLDDTLRAGMSFQVAMKFPGDSFPSVDPLAIQWGSDGAYVWAVREGKAVRTPVRIIQRNTENVLVEAELAPGDAVVTEGIHTVRQGADVQVAGGGEDGGAPPARRRPRTEASAAGGP